MLAQGQGKRKNKNEDSNFLDPFFLKSLFSRCGETISQVPHGCLSFGCGSSAGCEDVFEGHESGVFSGAGSAGGAGA